MTKIVLFGLAALAAFLTVCLLIGETRGDCPAPARVTVVYPQPTYSPPVYTPPVYSAPYYAPTVVVKKEVVAPVVFTKFVPVVPVALIELAILPTYSAQYVPPVQLQPGIPQPGIAQPAPAQQAPALAQQSGADMVKIMGMLEKINARLDRLEKGQQQQAPPVQPKQGEQGPPPKEEQVSALSIMRVKCAACHEAKTAADKGGNLVLISEDKLAELSPRQANKVVGRSYAGTMPPKDNKLSIAPLTDAEVSALVAQYAK